MSNNNKQTKEIKKLQIQIDSLITKDQNSETSFSILRGCYSKSQKNIKKLNKRIGQLNTQGIGLNKEELLKLANNFNADVKKYKSEIDYLKNLTTGLQAEVLSIQSFLAYNDMGYESENEAIQIEEEFSKDDEKETDEAEEKLLEATSPGIPDSTGASGCHVGDVTEEAIKDAKDRHKARKIVKEIHIDLYDFSNSKVKQVKGKKSRYTLSEI